MSLKSYLLMFGLGLMTAGSSLALGTQAGTAISNQATLYFQDDQGHKQGPISSNTVTTSVSLVCGVDLQRPQSQITPSGTTVYFSHTFSNVGNGPDTFRLNATSASGYPSEIILDANGNGIADPNEPTLTATSQIAPDHSVNILVAVDIPSSAMPNSSDAVTVSVRSLHDATARASNSDTLNITSGAALTLLKSVSPAGAQPPGTVLTYTLTYANVGTAGVKNARILDPLPLYTKWVSASDNGSFDPTAKIVTWPLGDLAPGAKGSVTFSVRIE